MQIRFEDDLIVDLGGTNFGLEIEDSMPTQVTRVIAKNITGNQEQLWSLDYIAGSGSPGETARKKRSGGLGGGRGGVEDEG